MEKFKTIKKLNNINIGGNALDIFMRRYALKGVDGKPKESIKEAFYRVASFIAEAEKTKKDKKKYTDLFYAFMGSKRFIPNTPTWSGAKTKLGQLAACFVLPISDDMGRESDGIFQTLRDAALIQQSGGGNGFSFSSLRPKGDKITSSNGIASGPLSFMEVYDSAFGKIAQGGTRRGANMAVLRVDHPDILDFIKCKSEEGKISNFNISVGITDKFMKAVKEDKDFDLVNPKNKKVWKKVKAREIFDELVKYSFKNGEPGILFLDRANRDNPVPDQYTLEATNPCVTGDTLIYTAKGLQRADILANQEKSNKVIVDSRLHEDKVQLASKVFSTGIKDVYKLKTKEGYEIKLTAKHKVMTVKGWVMAKDLVKGDKILILNREGGFGDCGSEELGWVLGWLVGDGTINKVRAVLSFFGEEKGELAPLMAHSVTKIVNENPVYNNRTRFCNVGVTQVLARNESRIQSDRLLAVAKECGLNNNKLQVPSCVFCGNKEIQKAFIQALFTADGYFMNGKNKGGSVRLTSISRSLLVSVQRVLINFGIASKIYTNRRKAGYRKLPDGKGGYKEYFCRSYHEVVISKENIITFAQEIGFLSESKQAKMFNYIKRCDKRGLYKESFTVCVSSLDFIGREMVYDLIQPTTKSFVANGVVVHNCGEQWLGGYENCCLGHINISESVKENRIDWNHLRESVILAVRFLDNLVTQNSYIPSVPQLKEVALKNRRIGLGFMGLGDAFYKMGIRYGSKKSLELASQITEFMRFYSMQESIELAKERGSFPGIKESIYNAKNFRWKIPKPLFEYEENFGRPTLKWNEIKKSLKKYGIRNAAQLSIAPTGTTATVFDVEGYGCEPVFALAYFRNVYQSAGGEENLRLTYVSPLFKKALEKAGLVKEKEKEVVKEALEKGTIKNCKSVPEDIRETFAVATDITADEHIEMQAAIQCFIDNSISKTCNFSESAVEEDIKNAYIKAWELGCKGLTVYVTGSRKEVVLETKETAEKKQGALLNLKEEEIRPRPSVVMGRTHKIATPVGKAFITVNRNGEAGKRPFEVFINIGKSGSDLSSMAEAMGRLISGWLRSAKEPVKALEDIKNQLRGIGGSMSVGFGQNRVSSLPDAVAKVLDKELTLSEKMEEDVYKEEDPEVEVTLQPSLFKGASICPECNNITLVETEGCVKCYSCSYTRC
ncbi:MAG: LAGLIDADG family homing endonuclease [bacterium]